MCEKLLETTKRGSKPQAAVEICEQMIDTSREIAPVGRLDIDTEGLLLLTDDGKLTHELLSPKKHVDKTYYAEVDGEITTDVVKGFEEGSEYGEKNPSAPGKLVVLRNLGGGEDAVPVELFLPKALAWRLW